MARPTGSRRVQVVFTIAAAAVLVVGRVVQWRTGPPAGVDDGTDWVLVALIVPPLLALVGLLTYLDVKRQKRREADAARDLDP